MSDPIVIQGYANLFRVKQAPLRNSSRPLVVKAGAFSLAALDAPLLFSHNPQMRYATTRNGSLRIWQDATGLAFEAEIRPTSDAWALADGIARGTTDRASMDLKSYTANVEIIDGIECDVLTRSRVGEISIACEGACAEAAVWLAETSIASLPEHSRRLAGHWAAGKAARALAKARLATNRARRLSVVPASLVATMASPAWRAGAAMNRNARASLNENPQ